MMRRLTDIEYIKSINSHINLQWVNSREFEDYGRIVSEFDFSHAIKYMEENTPIPEVGNIYIQEDRELERLMPKESIEYLFYGGMGCQAGYCNGVNSNLNALEFHKGSELTVAVTDLVLLLGKLRDIHEGTYDSENIRGFFVPGGTSVEIYASTLHFSPCKVMLDGFKAIIILPQGTNGAISKFGQYEKNLNNGYLEPFTFNKWLLIHEEAYWLKEKGACIGITGGNTKVNYMVEKGLGLSL